MRKSFKVAGHVFSFSIPKGHSLWKQLKQYAPFEISGDDNPIFELEVVESLLNYLQTRFMLGMKSPGSR